MAEKLKTETELYTLVYCADCNAPSFGKMVINDDTLNMPEFVYTPQTCFLETYDITFSSGSTIVSATKDIFQVAVNYYSPSVLGRCIYQSFVRNGTYDSVNDRFTFQSWQTVQSY